MSKQHNLLPLETLVDVLATHKITKQKMVNQMSLDKYYKLKSTTYTYQAFQIGFLTLEK